MAGRKEFEIMFKLAASIGGNFNSTFKTANATMKGLQSGLTKINSLQGKMNSFEKLSKSVDTNRSKLERLNATHEALQNQLKNTQTPSNELILSIQKNEEEITKVTSKIKMQETSLKSLDDELKKSGINTNDLTAENERLGKSYESIKKSQEKIGKINAKQSKNNQAISNAKLQMAGTIGVATAAAAALYKGPIQAASNFQAQMSTVQSISNASAADMQKLSEAAKKAGRETQFSAVESGQALEYMAMAGWKTSQMVDGLPGIMNLASASGEDLASVSDIVTDALSAFKLQAKDAAHFSDVLAQASSNSNTDVSMMGEAFKYVASTAGALNYNIEDVSVALGVMANNGVKGSMGGTSLKNTLVNLAKPTDKIKQKMDELNISLTDSSGQMLPLSKLLVNLRKSFSGLSEDEKAAAAATIAGKEGMSGLLAIVNTSDEDFNKLTKSINNADGAAERMSKIRLDNYEGQMTLCKSAIEGLQIALGNALLPTVTSGLKTITDLVSKFAEWADKNPKVVKGITMAATALVGMKVAGLALKIAFLDIDNGLLESNKRFEIGKIKLAGYKNGFLELPKVLQKGLKSIEMLGNSKLGKLFTKGLGNLSGPILNALAPLTTKLGSIFAPIMKMGSKILGPFSKIFSLIGGLIGPIMPVALAITAIVVALQLLMNHLQDIRKFILETFGYEALQAFDGVVNAITNIGNAITNMFSGEGLDGAREKINELFGEQGLAVFNGAITVIQAVGSAFMQIWNTINTYVTPMVEQLFNYVVNTVLPAVGAKFAEWAPTISTIISNLADGISTTIKIAATVVQAVMPVIRTAFEVGFKAIAVVVGGVLTLLEKISSAARGVKNVVSRVFGNGKQKGSGVPGFASGTNYTPNTFIAGENGPELITNAPGYKVYTASETMKLLNSMQEKGRPLPFGGKLSGNKSAILNYNPTVIVDGSRPNDLEEKLEENNEKLFEKFKKWLKDTDDDEERTVYA